MSAKKSSRAREPITRSRRSFRYKVPSQKLKRMVHCESGLERDAVRLIDALSSVATFQEQPYVIDIIDDDEAYSYTPDLEVIFKTGRVVLFEVKSERDLRRPQVKGRLERIATYLHRQQRDFRILSETGFRAPTLKANLRLRQLGLRQPAPAKVLVTALTKALETGPLPLGSLKRAVGDFDLWACVAHRVVFVDLKQPVNDALLLSLKEADDEAI